MGGNGKEKERKKERKSIYIAPFCTFCKRSGKGEYVSRLLGDGRPCPVILRTMCPTKQT